MVTASFINRLSEAVDRIETRTEPRPCKVVTVPRGYHEAADAARERHYAVHPEDRDADVLIWRFFDDKGTTDESGG